MQDNFLSVVEIKDEALKSYFKDLLNSKKNTMFKIGSYDSSKSTVNLNKFGEFTLQAKENINKHCLLFTRPQGAKNYTIEATGVKQGYLMKKDADFDFYADDMKNKRQTKVMHKDINLNKLPKARFVLMEDDERIKTMKMDPEEIKERLFEMFTEKPKMYFEEIATILDQPRGYLQSIIEQIADKKKEKNKFVYSLKDIYLVGDEYEKNKKIKKV